MLFVYRDTHLTLQNDINRKSLRNQETPLYFDQLSYDSRRRDLRSRAGEGAGEGTYVKKNPFEKKTAEWQQEVGHFVVGAVGEK